MPWRCSPPRKILILFDAQSWINLYLDDLIKQPMNDDYQIEYRESLSDCLIELHRLLDACYPRPPRDVFYRLVSQYRSGFPAWIVRTQAGQLVGFVHLAPNSKGGTLETLAVDPAHRRQGIAQALVRRLVESTEGVISLTTRIPDFFISFGFEQIRALPDGSVYMIQIRSVSQPISH